MTVREVQVYTPTILLESGRAGLSVPLLPLSVEEELEADLGKLDKGSKCVSLHSERKGWVSMFTWIHATGRRWNMVAAKVVGV
jgi:hypothetical protein